MSGPARIREVVDADLDFMRQMLFEAFFWDPSIPRPPLSDFAAESEFRKLLGQWGRAGDRGLIAEQNGIATGAAWFRLWTVDVHSYGFISPTVPEIAMAVKQGCRFSGVGRALLERLIEVARADGYSALSLSVSRKNYAFKLYTSMGFRRVGEDGTSWTLMLSLGKNGIDA